MAVTVGVLALQGAFVEHINLLRKASAHFIDRDIASVADNCSGGAGAGFGGFGFLEVRTPEQLHRCDALVIPGGESTTLAFVAAQTKLLEPLRHFVKVDRKPTWGTCAGLILLADETTGSKKGGQELVGGLNVRAHRNYFGRQVHSFQSDLDLPFLAELGSSANVPSGSGPFPGVFIRAPVVEEILPAPNADGTAPSDLGVERAKGSDRPAVEVLGVVSRGQEEDIIAVRQGNIFATSFHPELTDDVRIHLWWLHQVVRSKRRA